MSTGPGRRPPPGAFFRLFCGEGLTSNGVCGIIPKLTFAGMSSCGCSSMVESQPSKLVAWVRFPSPAPRRRKKFRFVPSPPSARTPPAPFLPPFPTKPEERLSGAPVRKFRSIPPSARSPPASILPIFPGKVKDGFVGAPFGCKVRLNSFSCPAFSFDTRL